MKERRQGVILNDIGNSCERTDYNYVAGSSGNASLVAFTRCLGGVSMDYGVRILAVSPGPVDTGRLETMLKKRATLPEWGGQEAGWQVKFDSLKIAVEFGGKSLVTRSQGLLQRFPGGRAATSREVADVIVFLCSDRAG